jgi:hypothetical protein
MFEAPDARDKLIGSRIVSTSHAVHWHWRPERLGFWGAFEVVQPQILVLVLFYPVDSMPVVNLAQAPSSTSSSKSSS